MIRKALVLCLLMTCSAYSAETRFYNNKGQYVGRALENHGRTNYFDSKERLLGHSTNGRPINSKAKSVQKNNKQRK